MELILLHDDGSVCERWYIPGEFRTVREAVEDSGLDLYGSKAEFDKWERVESKE